MACRSDKMFDIVRIRAVFGGRVCYSVEGRQGNSNDHGTCS